MTDISKIDMERIEGLISKLESMKYVVETWNEGTEWYRIWSDGWIEQGGLIYTTEIVVVTFHKPFTTTTYHPLISIYGDATDVWGDKPTIVNNSLTTTQMTLYHNIRSGNYPNLGFLWYACGY